MNMSARIINIGGWLSNQCQVAWQEYDLAKQHLEAVRESYSPLSPGHVERFTAALERRSEAFRRCFEREVAD